VCSVDILINNAGALWWKKLVDTPMKRSVPLQPLQPLALEPTNRESHACVVVPTDTT